MAQVYLVLKWLVEVKVAVASREVGVVSPVIVGINCSDPQAQNAAKEVEEE